LAAGLAAGLAAVFAADLAPFVASSLANQHTHGNGAGTKNASINGAFVDRIHGTPYIAAPWILWVCVYKRKKTFTLLVNFHISLMAKILLSAMVKSWITGDAINP